MNNNEAYLRLVGETGQELVVPPARPEAEPKVAQAGITDNRDYIRLECDGCGATLPRVTDPECEYCGAKYAKVRRYNGPEIPEHYAYSQADGSLIYASSTSARLTTRSYGGTEFVTGQGLLYGHD